MSLKSPSPGAGSAAFPTLFMPNSNTMQMMSGSPFATNQGGTGQVPTSAVTGGSQPSINGLPGQVSIPNLFQNWLNGKGGPDGGNVSPKLTPGPMRNTMANNPFLKFQF